jgi:hypothetical protein
MKLQNNKTNKEGIEIVQIENETKNSKIIQAKKGLTNIEN